MSLAQKPGTGSPPNLTTLKILVVVMGIAIVACVIVIVVAISNRLQKAEAEAEQAAAASPATVAAPAVAAAPATSPAAPLAQIGELSIAMPEGCVIAEAGAEAGRLIVRLDGLADRGCQQVVLIDLATGETLGRITAVPQP